MWLTVSSEHANGAEVAAQDACDAMAVVSGVDEGAASCGAAGDTTVCPVAAGESEQAATCDVTAKPAGAPRGKRPRIRITCVDQLGECRCHHGHKPGDVFDFDRDRGRLCPMACHVGFPYIDILRYGGTVPGNEPGTAKFCCPEVDTLNVFLAEVVD
jgi:uncharacterized repeat protein (TIGR04076 family)